MIKLMLAGCIALLIAVGVYDREMHKREMAALNSLGFQFGKFHQDATRRLDSIGSELGRFQQDTAGRLSSLGTELGRFQQDTTGRLASIGSEFGRFGADTRNSIASLAPTLSQAVIDMAPKVVAGRSSLVRAYTAEPIVLQPFDEDPTVLDSDALGAGFHDTSLKTELQCPIQTASTAVILIGGQSLADNRVEMHHKAGPKVFNFNVYDGKCYATEDPLLGTTDRRGNFSTVLGESLISSSIYDVVVLIPIAVGATHIGQWAPEGTMHRRLLVAIEKARRQKLFITHVLWQQGEADGLISNGGMYQRAFEDIWISLRQHGVTAPIFVARSSYCGSTHSEISEAQAKLVNEGRRIFAGADTDALGEEFREADHCHLTPAGAMLQAKMWAAILREYRGGYAEQ
jgi:hypothetical protein